MLQMLSLAVSIAVAAPHESARDVTRTEHFAVPHSTISERHATEAHFLATMNEVRRTAGLAPLAHDDELTVVAREHAHDMLANHYFGHVAPDGVTPSERLRRHGYRYRVTGENIAFCSDERNAEAALWHSDGHRRNELEPRFHRAGVAVLRTGPYGALFVEVYSD